MAIGSTSTDDQVQAQIDDNANYDEIRSVASARSYRTAVRVMIGRLSRRAEASDAGSSIRAEINDLSKQMDQVQQWLNTNDTDDQAQSGALPIEFSFENFRDR